MAITYSLEDAWRKHQHCELVIYHNQFSDGQVVPGLYCKQYGTWIQWLDIKTADQLILEGLEVVLTKPKKIKGHPVKWFTGEELGI